MNEPGIFCGNDLSREHARRERLATACRGEKPLSRFALASQQATLQC